MKNQEVARTLGNGHTIEFGLASWDEDGTELSVRNRYSNVRGGFNKAASGEIQVLPPMSQSKLANSSA